jgi:hypothetical protein
MPPLVATGISLTDRISFDPVNTFIIFLLNVAGILIGSIFVFWIMGFSKLYEKH